MKQYRLTLDEAQQALSESPLNPLDESNRILMRELAWIRAAVACEDYPSRQFRESVNMIFELQRAKQRFYYGATGGRGALITDSEKRPLIIRWHDGARGRVFTNEHPIDLREVFMAMRARAAKLSYEDIYHNTAQFIFFVGAATTEELRGHRAATWDGKELFARFREKGIKHLYLFPGKFKKVGCNWVVE